MKHRLVELDGNISILTRGWTSAGNLYKNMKDISNEYFEVFGNSSGMLIDIFPVYRDIEKSVLCIKDLEN